VLAIGDAWKPDRTIVLTSGSDTIEKHIRLRGRPHEEAERTVERFRLIDAEFRRLAPRYANTVVIDRDGKEFHERSSLDEIIRLAGLPRIARFLTARWTATRGASGSGRSARRRGSTPPAAEATLAAAPGASRAVRVVTGVAADYDSAHRETAHAVRPAPPAQQAALHQYRTREGRET
jgi:hypothetical protein